MEQRTLGRTGLQVSAIGFGRGPTAGLMIYGTAAEQAAADMGTSSVVLRVLESGTLAGVSRPHPTSGQARSPGRDFADTVERARAMD